jgi:hypothetical protein
LQEMSTPRFLVDIIWTAGLPARCLNQDSDDLTAPKPQEEGTVIGRVQRE